LFGLKLILNGWSIIFKGQKMDKNTENRASRQESTELVFDADER